MTPAKQRLRSVSRPAVPRLAAVRPVPRESAARDRQRLRLIDACISALHLHGPSRTTVEKVVGIAKMSPGIVRFYFDSKAAMLVASLQFLAAEFEQRVLDPVAALKDDPVAALERLVDLYLDPVIASARKVSVWYAFWGEASSRQEYYDICGQKDERFAALVRELIERLIADTKRAHLDPDGVSLGFIGALEILWQGIAFQPEGNIDRGAGRRRCMSYLRSVFPGRFEPPLLRSAPVRRPAADGARPSRWTYCSDTALQLERAGLFAGAYQFVGDQRAVPRPGDYAALDVGAERVLVVRGADLELRAFRNCCPAVPHALASAYLGRWPGAVECRIHGIRFQYDGGPSSGAQGASLEALELRLTDDWIWVRRCVPGPAAARAADPLEPGWYGTAALHRPGDDGGPHHPVALPAETLLHANWKIVVEQWLDAAPGWAAQSVTGDQWSARRYHHLLAAASRTPWQRRFIAPNQFIDRRPDGVTIVQMLPAAPGLTRLRTFDYAFRDFAASARGLCHLARRLTPERRRAGAVFAESVQRAIAAYGYEAAAGAPRGPAAAEFHGWLLARIPVLAEADPSGCALTGASMDYTGA